MPVYLHESDVIELFRPEPHYTGVVDAAELAHREYANGNFITPPQERVRLVYPPNATRRPYAQDMRILPAMLPGLGVAGVRIGCAVDGTGQGSSYTMLLDFESMETLAIMEDHYLHGIRSGISTGIGTRHFSRPDSSVVCVIGAGRINEVQLAATLGERNITEVRVFSRNPENRKAWADKQAALFGVSVIPANSIDEALDGADIILSATNSHNDPVLDGNMLAKGSYIGSVTPGEIDPTTALRSRIITTSKNRVETDYTPQEPLYSLLKSGQLDMNNIPLLGAVLNGDEVGRRNDDEIVFLFSPGIGFLDVVVAKYAYELALSQDAGVKL